MDLISREAVDNAMYDYCHSCDVNESQMENYFCDLPSAFEGMTNGEVMKAVFPMVSVFENIEFQYPYIDVFYPDESGMPMHSYKKGWWDSPYKGVSE